MELTQEQVAALKALYDRTVDVWLANNAIAIDRDISSYSRDRANAKVNESWGILYGIEETLARIGLEVETDETMHMVGTVHGYRKIIDGHEVFTD